MTTVADRIAYLNPCREALRWANGYTDPTEAWEKCQRGDWMLWLVGKKSGDAYGERRRKLVLAACDCAAIALVHTKDGRVSKCIEVAKRWANGSAANEELIVARKDGYAAAYVGAYGYAAAYAANAAYAARAAAAAAYAANAAAASNAPARNAYVVADAAAASNAADAADAYARKKTLKDCADIVRRYYPDPPNVD